MTYIENQKPKKKQPKKRFRTFLIVLGCIVGCLVGLYFWLFPVPKTPGYYKMKIKTNKTAFEYIANNFPETDYNHIDLDDMDIYTNYDYLEEVDKTLYKHLKTIDFTTNIDDIARYNEIVVFEGKSGRQFDIHGIVYSPQEIKNVSKYLHSTEFDLPTYHITGNWYYYEYNGVLYG
jgi:hypothetical protein